MPGLREKRIKGEGIFTNSATNEAALRNTRYFRYLSERCTPPTFYQRGRLSTPASAPNTNIWREYCSQEINVGKYACVSIKRGMLCKLRVRERLYIVVSARRAGILLD
jgi:hypothetical protein